MAQIPVNTRAVGEPKGACLLYIEDYVHTFIRKIEQEGTERAISLWGYEFEEQGRYYFIISGAIDLSLPAVTGERFFPSSCCIGQAVLTQGAEGGLGLELTLPNRKKLVFHDFFIYYDQNEEMQNYLIEWNLSRHKGSIRLEQEDAVRFSRIAGHYNREEARVSYLWNVMNLLSLGLLVCIAAFAIISVNNYYKMREMENRLTYLMSLPVQTMAAIEDSVTRAAPTKAHEADESTATAPLTQEAATEEALSEEAVSEEAIIAESAAAQPVMNEPAGAAAQLQYYVVQRGDTLRSISYQVYGTYSRVEDICRWNGIENADSILYGQTLLLQPE